MSEPRDALEAAVLEAPPIAGWYGKLPCLGDFATRRLQPDFVQSWDNWLQRSIAASRGELGERWLELFLTSPMWRFALAPGVCGREAWAGLLVPSVDRVGRYFPLTLALCFGSGAGLQRAFAASEWFAQLETIALSALSVDFSTDQLESALAASPFPAADATAAPTPSARDVAGWLDTGSGSPCALQLPAGEPIASVMAGAARAIHEACAAGRTFWWTVSEGGTTETHMSVGMPPEDYFAVLLGASRSRDGAAPAVSADPLKALGLEDRLDPSEPKL